MLYRIGEKTRAHIAMLIFAFLVSTSFTVGRAITFSLDPAALTFLRFSMALGIFFVIALLSRKRLRFPTMADGARYLFLALLLVAFFVTMFEGLRWSTPLSAGAVFTLTPFFTAAMSLMFFRHRMSLAGFGGLLVAGLASLWIMFEGNIDDMLALRAGRGEMIFLVGCLAYAAYAPAVEKLHRGTDLVIMTLWTLAAGALLLLLYGWRPIINTQWHLVSPLVYLGVGWLAVFTTSITFYLIQYAAIRLPGVNVMAYILLVPGCILLQRLANGGSWPEISVIVALAVLGAAMLVLQFLAR